MKKLYIILSNILVLAVLLGGLNHLMLRYNIFPETEWNLNSFDKKIDLTGVDYEDFAPKLLEYKVEDDLYNQFCGETRLDFGAEYTKNPVLVFGCSYSYGHGLKREQSFPYLLSEYTKRPVLNLSKCGTDALDGLTSLDIYMQASDRKIKNQSSADYIIYIYMYDHINRYLARAQLMEYYEEFFKPSFIEKCFIKIYLFKYLFAEIRKKIILHGFPESEKSERFLKRVMEYLINQFRALAPKAEIIFIIYDEKIPFYWQNYAALKYEYRVLNSKIWQETASEYGIKVIHTKDLTGIVYDKNYKLEYDISNWHPNERVWREFTPLFAEKYIK